MGKCNLLVWAMFLPLLSYAQLDCSESPVPSTYSQGVGEWKAYVFQLSPDYNPNEDYSRVFSPGSKADRVYKGYLPHSNDFLPVGSLNFDIDFGDQNSYESDHLFFRTNKEWKNNNIGGCETQLQNFGVIFRSRVTIPNGQSGIYRFRVGSDDGSRLKLSIREGNIVVKDTIPHDNWGGPKTYVYSENVFNYYIELKEGQTVNLDLMYYERQGSNRISFNMIKYLGPGEIEGSQNLCGISPDPAPFKSRGPAAVVAGTISYQWQRSLIDDDDPQYWTDIAGATNLTYKVPQFVKNGEDQEIYFYRRVATNNSTEGSKSIATDPVMLNVNYIDDLNQQEFGSNRWIGHIYKGKADYSDKAYLGRLTEDSIFAQNFNYNNVPSSPVYFTPEYGCEFLTDEFSVKFKMQLSVEPGDYTFMVRGDDGFRLSIDGGATWAINRWTDGGKSTYVPTTLKVDETGVLDLVLEYYENKIGNYIDFTYDFEALILPLVWGEFRAEACGPANCLTWETIQEKNTSHFELERSYNGMDWEMFDNSVLAQGNSTEKISYDFTDNQFMASKVYYRIRQVDLDGAYEYSEVMRVDNPFYATGFLPFPNPTMDKIRFFSKSEVVGLWLVSNDYLVNKEVKPEMMNDNRYEVDLVGLKPGNYVMVVETRDGERDVFKVIKK